LYAILPSIHVRNATPLPPDNDSMSKKYKTGNDTQSKSRRTAKTWKKGSSSNEHYAKKRSYDAQEDAVPNRAVTMNLRMKNLQHKERLSLAGALEGQVIDSTGRSWIVECRDTITNETTLYDCLVGRSITSENPSSTLVAVGDRVAFRTEPTSGETNGLPIGVLLLVRERATKLARESAGRDGMEQVIVSNIDQLIILMAAADPFYNRRLIDRYLIAAELGNVAPIICINKLDLMDKAFVREDLKVYSEILGIPTLLVSAEKHTNIDALRELLTGKSSVFSGPSGVGKSTIVNLLLNDEVQATTEVSAKKQKGSHTTTFSTIFPLPGGGYILDTPGIREFGIWGLDPSDVSFYFHDFDEYRLKCRFAPCSHIHEPHCAVKAAVEEGEIDPERYESYLRLLETMADKRER
jgi:ribosome biogenesis GTPase / thiamine phosphate phosphatase